MTTILHRQSLHKFLGFLFRKLTRVEVEGWDRVPREGGAILAVNHLSRLDPPLIFVLCKRHDLTVLVAEKYHHWPIIRQMLEAVDGIWINRSAPDAQALRRALRYLRQGGMLGIAPEGTRSKTGGLQRGKPGVVYLAALSGVPIVPIAIYGTERWWKAWLCLRRPVLHVRVGEPFVVGQMPAENRDAWLQEKADEVMLRIAALLPPAYRGVYAQHPRLREFLRPEEEEEAP